MPQTRRFATLLLLVSLLPLRAQAVVIQILHTNDLHAAMKTAGEPKSGEPEYGGWAQIKHVLDEWTRKAAEQQIPTLRVDAGDFLEGTLLYFPKGGENVLRAYQKMGFDVTTLGNHDWMMGATSLDRLLDTVPFNHPLLSANIDISSRLTALHEQLQPAKVIEIGGVKLGFFGLSTTEAFYKWIGRIQSRRKDFRIRDYLDSESEPDENGDRVPVPGIASQWIEKLKPQADAVIALTHIGFDEDLQLAGSTRGLNLVIGGHSHTFLQTLSTTRDLDDQEVPVVQAGYNGHSIGRVLLEVVPGQRPRVLTTELIDVPHETERDPEIQALTETAIRDVRELYTPEKLDEKIGESEVRLVPGKSGPTAFSRFAVDSIRESIDASVGIDVNAFHGNTAQPGGDVTREKLMEAYPRKFEVERNEGYYVYKVHVPGFALALALKYALKYGISASFSGVDFEARELSDEEFEKAQQKEGLDTRAILTRFRAKNIQVNGQSICLTCVYDVAVPESVIRGAYSISPLFRLILWGGHRTEHTIWDAMESHLRRIQVIRPLGDDDQSSSRRYSNSYLRQFGRHLDPAETTPMYDLKSKPAPEAPKPSVVPAEEELPVSVAKTFVKRALRLKSKKQLLRDEDELDSVEAEGQP